MKISRTRKALLLAAVLLMASTTVALAQGGWGCYPNRDFNHYGGRHMMGPDWGTGYGPCYTNLSKEEAAKVDAERDRFFTETRTLRRDMEDKAYELRKAINSDDPDAGKISALQKELSELKADFDQKLIQHRLIMRKILPENARFLGPNSSGVRYGRGKNGYCWTSGQNGYCWRR